MSKSKIALKVALRLPLLSIQAKSELSQADNCKQWLWQIHLVVII